MVIGNCYYQATYILFQNKEREREREKEKERYRERKKQQGYKMIEKNIYWLLCKDQIWLFSFRTILVLVLLLMMLWVVLAILPNSEATLQTNVF